MAAAAALVVLGSGGGRGGGAPRCIAECGERLLSSSPLASNPLSPVSESEGDTAASAHCMPSSSTSTILGSRPLPRAIPACFATTDRTVWAGTLTYSVGRAPHMAGVLLSR